MTPKVKYGSDRNMLWRRLAKMEINPAGCRQCECVGKSPCT